MSINSGIIVSYTDTSGNLQKGIVRHTDQHEEFTKSAEFEVDDALE